MIPSRAFFEWAFLLLCAAWVMTFVGIGLGALVFWLRERRHMAMLQDELDAADREGRARDARARAMQSTFGRPRLRG